MGYKLRRRLREVLGGDVKGLQRLVALEIADDANDDDRRSLATLEQLAMWTGAGSPAVVRTMLKRLADAGWEFRVPLGKGSDGRTLYAVPGKRLTFRVPPLEGRTVVPPMAGEGVTTDTPSGEGGTVVTPTSSQGGTTVPSEETLVASMGTGVASEGTPVTPSSSSPQIPSSLLVALALIRAAGVVAESEERDLAEWISKKHPPAAAPWWQKVAANGDLQRHADGWRAARRAERAGGAPPVADVLSDQNGRPGTAPSNVAQYAAEARANMRRNKHASPLDAANTEFGEPDDGKVSV